MNKKFNLALFQKTSCLAMRNRAQAGPSHTGGSISFSEHEERERSKGAEFAFKDLYKRLHTFQDGPRRGEFVSERSHDVLADVEQIQHRYTQIDSTSSVSSYALLNEKELFIEAAGGMKKGRVFGLGSEASAICRCETTISSARENLELLQDVRKEIKDEYKQKFQKLKKQMVAVCKTRDDARSFVLGAVYEKLRMGPIPAFQTDFSTLSLDDAEDDEGAHDDSFIPLADYHLPPGSGSNPPPPPPSVAAPAQYAV